MGEKALFLDSYAIHEIIEGNENYKPYIKDVGIVTTKLNLMEVYYDCLIRKGEIVADEIYEKFKRFCVAISDDVIKEAMQFRAKIKKANVKSNISYIDAIGYVLAKKHGIKFLTGDKEFKDMDNVEFVK